VDWTVLAQNGTRWWALVNAVMKPSGLIKCGEFLDLLASQGFCSTESVKGYVSKNVWETVM
jgi:hypothetical protein